MSDNFKKGTEIHISLNHLFRWQFSSSLYMTLLQLITIILLGRYLGYRELGIYSIFQIVFRLASAIFEPGMFVSLIQKPSYNFLIIRKQWKIQMAMVVFGILILSLFFYLESNYLMENPLIVLICILLFTLIGSGSLYPALLTHYLKQKDISMAQMAASTIEFIFIISAIHWFPPLNIFCFAFLMRFAIYYGLSYYNLRKLNMSEDADASVNEHLSYSSYQTLNQGLSFVQGNFDTVLVGGVFGLLLLGPYNFASEFSYLLFSKINPIFNKAVFPYLSKHQANPTARQKIITESLMSHALLCISLYLILFSHVDRLIGFLFIDEQGQIAGFATYMLVLAMIRSVNNIIFNQLLALGHSKNLLHWNITVLVINYLFIGIIYLTKTSITGFLMINIFLSLSVFIFSIYKLMNFFTDQRIFLLSLGKYLFYFITCAITLYCFNRFGFNLIPSMLMSLVLLFLISFLFYRKKVLDLIHLRIM